MSDDMAGMMAQCQEMMRAMGDHDPGRGPAERAVVRARAHSEETS